MPISFLKNWSIDISKVQQYAAFRGKFQLQLDYQMLNMLWAFEHPEFTVERKQALEPIIHAINKNTNILEVKHTPRYGIGRFYADNAMSPICLSRHIKHTLFTYLDWIDIDMVKGHATMLYEIARINNINLPAFKRYIENFNDIVETLIGYYSTENPITKDDVKTCFNVMIYGGSVNTWMNNLEERGIILSTRSIHVHIADFKRDCEKVITLVYLNNSKITDLIKGAETDEYKLKNRTMSYFCQTIENDILHHVYKVLLSKKVIQPKAFALEYDGLCFKSPDETIDMDVLLDEVNEHIHLKTGLKIYMKWKPYDDVHVHHEVITQRNNIVPIATLVNEVPLSIDCVQDTLETCETYAQFKNVFERNHFKCRMTSSYYKEDRTCSRDESIELISYTEHAIKIAYRDYNYIETTTKGKEKIKYFIDEWFDDTTIRVYESMRCLPPPLKCPSNVYNTWVPFAVTLCSALEKDEHGKCIIPEEDKDEIEKRYQYICKHIYTMCGKDEVSYDYFMAWLGYMLAYPSEKSIMPNIIGAPGCGKSEMINFIISLFGEARCLVTSKPQDDVWGQFNSMIANKYFVVLEELSSKQTIEYEGVIKDLITGGRININTKGTKQYSIDSFLKFIALSNTITCKTTVGDRRNFMIKSSSEHIGDTTYFNTLRLYQADQRIQMLFYERLLEIPNLYNFRNCPIPLTAYQKTLQNANREDYDLFIEEWVNTNEDDAELLVISSKTLFQDYLFWKRSNGMTERGEKSHHFIRNISLHFEGMIFTTAHDKMLHTRNGNMVRIYMHDIKKRLEGLK